MASEGLLIAERFIQAREGFRARAYRDTGGVWTVGYGATGPDIGADTVWAAAQAEADLRDRLVSMYGPAVTRAVRVRLTSNQHAALISLAYNIGVKAFVASTLIRVLNTGDYVGAANHFADFIKAHVHGQLITIQGLVHRRAAEAELFLGEAA